MDGTDGHPHHHHDTHRGWVRPGGRRGRWVEPFLLVLIGRGDAHGAELIERLDELCLASGGVDVGMAYRALREFEAEGLVSSSWVTDKPAPRRVYQLTPEGSRALLDWTGVMRERERLVASYLELVEGTPASAGQPDTGAPA